MDSGIILNNSLAGGLDLQATLESGQTYLWDRDDGNDYLSSGLKGGDACLATPEQIPIYDEMESMSERKVTPGGAGLNSACAARYVAKTYGFNSKGIAYAGCVG